LLGAATARMFFVAPVLQKLLVMLYEARARESVLLLEASFHATGAGHIQLSTSKNFLHF
jgi:hypothetical protein